MFRIVTSRIGFNLTKKKYDLFVVFKVKGSITSKNSDLMKYLFLYVDYAFGENAVSHSKKCFCICI